MKQITIGIIGTGPIGRGLAELWHRAGYQVTLGARSATSESAQLASEGIPVTTYDEAASAEIVVLSVPHAASEAVIHRLSERLIDKVVISTTNAATLNNGQIVSALPLGESEGLRLSRLLPKSRIVRAFSHIQHELLVSRATMTPGLWAVGYATDHAEHTQAELLLSDTGYSPISVGSLNNSAILDPGGAFFPRMLTKSEAQNLAFSASLSSSLLAFNEANLGKHLHPDIRWHFPFGPSLGIPSTFIGKEAVIKHLEGVRTSGVHVGNVQTELLNTSGAVIRAQGTFPTPNGFVESPIVSTVHIQDAQIIEVYEYWDTAALKSD